MNMNLKVLTAGVLFFTGQALVAQEAKKDSASKRERDRHGCAIGSCEEKNIGSCWELCTAV